MYRIIFALGLIAASPVWAQEHQHPAPASPAQEHVHHADQGRDNLFPSREGSGTSWLPVTTPMYGGHARGGGWDFMWHGSVFLQFINESAEEHRGAHQTGSVNWVMGMARRRVGSGRVGVRAMFSAEPWTIRDCGYPDLLATGEICDGDTIHDRQHPHDLFMELALEYERPIGRGLRWHIYGGPAGEPALGPVAFPHRPSATSNLLAPISHHWLDATHITFGVVTTGIRADRWSADASAFNGREPDENRTDVDLGALDSYAGRVTFAPSDRLVLQASAGRLNEAEQHPGFDPTDLTRVTASAVYHRPIQPSIFWATTVAWGVNIEPVETTHALLLESSVSVRERHVGFLRGEIVGKPAHDLHVHESNEVFTVGKLQLGYAHYLKPAKSMQLGFGGSVSASLVPNTLAPRYGGNIAPGFAVFLHVRPGPHQM
jgi:hypothetical protein